MENCVVKINDHEFYSFTEQEAAYAIELGFASDSNMVTKVMLFLKNRSDVSRLIEMQALKHFKIEVTGSVFESHKIRIDHIMDLNNIRAYMNSAVW